MKKITPVILTAVLLTASACGTAPSSAPLSESSHSAAASAGDIPQASYRQISQEQAKEMMRAKDGHIIVDVRRQDEYDSGHIPGAILIPNETIGTERPAALPDPDSIILIYCRSGRRSKEAAQKLADMGYTNIYEFGGIIDWTGAVVTAEATEHTEPEEEHEMKLKIGEQEIPVTWEDNASVDALKAMLPLTIDLSMYGGFEQVGSLGQRIVRSDVQMTTKPGDIVLYSGDQIVLFYGSNTWSYTKLGTAALSESELQTLLGSGNVQITLSE